MKDWSDSQLNSKDNRTGGTKTPQETVTAPEGTATAPEGTATAPEGTATPPTGGGGSYSGSQADIVVQKDKVLKIYKHGCGYNAAVLPLVKRLRGKGFVVDLFDYGTMTYEGEQRQFELMEYCPEGALSGANLKGNKEAILTIVRKVAEALNACHNAGFIHKDVKPANILIRQPGNLDCVLCDFGIADVLDHGKVVTGQARTPIYAAPEVYERIITLEGKTLCELTPAADFYSLGMTILCLWYGESAFRSKEKQLAVTKVHDGIVVPTDIPEPLYTLTRGLLVKDPAHRWGWEEVNSYLSGKPVEVYDEHRKGGLNIIFNSSKNQVAQTVEELAAFMVQDLNLAVKYLYSGKISKWLEHIPELQIEIENIVEKEFPRQQQMGVLAATHTLNPFYDLNLCCDLHDPAYAMTGESIGKALNEAYWHYFGQEDADLIATQLAESFTAGRPEDYVPWFFDHKGQRFVQQRKWFDYCVKGDAANGKKAGPKDANYLHQVAMMKAISGFGATPEYHLSRTGEVLKGINDIYRAPKKELRYDLEHDKGLRGWLAVLCHENPHANLKKKYSYEKLLEQYVSIIGYINADDPVYHRFRYAQDQAMGITVDAKNKIRETWSSSFLQKFFGVLLGFIPLTVLLVRIILNIIDNPILDMTGGWTTYLFYGFGLVVAIFVYFAGDSDGCLVPIIAGAIVSVIVTILFGLLGKIILYLFGLAVLAALVFFSFPILFNYSRHRTKTSTILNPGFEELTLEPLYYAFSNEKQFDSSLNGAVDVKATARWKEDVRKRWILLVFLIASTVVFWLLGRLMPESERMDRFDRFFRIPNHTEKIQDIQDDEMQKLPNPKP